VEGRGEDGQQATLVKCGAAVCGATMRRRPFGTVLIGPSALLREGLARILCAADFRIIGSAARIDDIALTSLSRDQAILLIMDAGEDADGAVQQLEQFRKQHSAGRIAVLAEHYNLSEVISAFRAGANAYFVKVATCDVFIKALELVMLGETLLPPAILSLILGREDSPEDETISSELGEIDVLPQYGSSEAPRLSDRERCILRCLIEGHSNKSIARKINIAEATVKVHIKAILRKIRVQNRTQAAIWAMNNGSFVSAVANRPSTPARIHAEHSPSPSVIRDLVPVSKSGLAVVRVDAKDHEQDNVASPTIDRLVGKGISRKIG
jgi:DNA-binding NarL/FixJ family response regulator